MSALVPEALLAYAPFRVFSPSRLEALLNFCSHLYVRKGQVLLEPGSVRNLDYFLMSGQVCFEKTGETVGPDFPHALNYKYQHRDVLRAVSDCSLFQVDSDILDRFVCWAQVGSYLDLDIASQRQYDDKAEWMRTLLQSNLFYKVSPLNLQKIFSYMSPMEVRQGQVIINQGEIGDCCYFVKKGAVKVTRQLPGQSETLTLADVGVGGCVGEDALLHEALRNATVTVSEDGLLMKMDKRDFVQLLREPPVETLLSSELDMAIQTGVGLLDVRTEEEYEYNHLSGALCMPLELLRVKCRLLDPYQPYVVYCDTDRRSKAAAYLLEQQGIRARALVGGLNTLPLEQKNALMS